MASTRVGLRESARGTIAADELPYEFDLRPENQGFTLRGWDYTRKEIAIAINNHQLLNPAMELGSNICPWNCSFCFTEDPTNPHGHKRRLTNEMSLQERIDLIKQAAALGARSINWVGAGEPTIDPDFWTILEYMVAQSITPLLYSEGALRLTKQGFVKRLFDLGATVILKANSLWNHEYQNSVVRGSRKTSATDNYAHLRNQALQNLLSQGFADCNPTRLGLDTIVCKQNVDEVPSLHRFARRHNIFVLLVNYLPSGRSSSGSLDALSHNEQMLVFDEIRRIDAAEFGITHRSIFPYAGGVPCSIRGTGLFVKITGEVFDCPGELIPLGNVRHRRLSDIWEQARPITESFDGGCAPRDNFWRSTVQLSRR